MAGSKQITKRLYECDDCHERRFVAWVELNRAARPRCYGCGSQRLELVSEDAKDDRARLNRQRIVGSGGSLELSKELDRDSHHKTV
jgi:hypothetical protein